MAESTAAVAKSAKRAGLLTAGTPLATAPQAADGRAKGRPRKTSAGRINATVVVDTTGTAPATGVQTTATAGGAAATPSTGRDATATKGGDGATTGIPGSPADRTAAAAAGANAKAKAGGNGKARPGAAPAAPVPAPRAAVPTSPAPSATAGATPMSAVATGKLVGVAAQAQAQTAPERSPAAPRTKRASRARKTAVEPARASSPSGPPPTAGGPEPAGSAAHGTSYAWTDDELAEVRAELNREEAHLRSEIAQAESASVALQQGASGEGPGDEADAGTKTFEREHELSLANNSRSLLLQVERALHQLDAHTYGHCESCGQAIPKGRLQAFPRATLCVACKQREERR